MGARPTGISRPAGGGRHQGIIPGAPAQPVPPGCRRVPKEVYSVEEILEVAKRASECRVKLGYRRKETEEGRRRIQVLKVKARTKRYLYTIVFEDIEKGLEFVRGKLREVCSNIVFLDPELEEKVKAAPSEGEKR